MSENIIMSATISIPNGPKIPLNLTLPVEAYDKIEITVPSGATDLTVDLQPSAAGRVLFLLVASDWYGTMLSYKTKAAGTSFILDEPHLLTGKGALTMLEPATAISKLLFSNTTAGLDAKDAKVQILVGRDATP